MNGSFGEHELHKSLAFGWELDRNLNHYKGEMTASHMKSDKGNEQIADWGWLISPGHELRLIDVRVFAKFILGQLDNVRVSSREFPALKRLLKEINPDNFCGDEDGFGMFAANDDALTRKEFGGVNGFPDISGGCVARLNKGVSRAIGEVEADG